MSDVPPHAHMLGDPGKQLDSPTPTDSDSGAPLTPAMAPTPPTLAPPAAALSDGGARGWMSIAGCFLLSFVQFGMANAFGVFQAHYERHQLAGWRSDQISWIGSIQQFILFVGGLFTGRLFDAYGAHRLLIPGTFVFLLSIFLTSVCTAYWHFMLCQGILFGLGSSLVFHPVISVPTQWFPRRRAMASAITFTGSGLGGTLWPIVLQRMIAQLGFGWALRAVGFIALGLMSVGIALVRSRLPRKKLAPLAGLLRPLSEAPFALLALGAALSIWGMFMPFFFITLNAERLHAAPSLASYTLSFLNGGSTVGRFVAMAGDKVGRFNCIVVNTALTGVLLLAWWVALQSVGALIAFAVVYGLFAGVVISLLPAAMAQISAPHELGARIGLMYALVGCFMLSDPPINGALIARGGGRGGGRDGGGESAAAGFRYAGVFSGAACLGGAGLMLAARLRLDRRLGIVC